MEPCDCQQIVIVAIRAWQVELSDRCNRNLPASPLHDTGELGVIQ